MLREQKNPYSKSTIAEKHVGLVLVEVIYFGAIQSACCFATPSHNLCRARTVTKYESHCETMNQMLYYALLCYYVYNFQKCFATRQKHTKTVGNAQHPSKPIFLKHFSYFHKNVIYSNSYEHIFYPEFAQLRVGIAQCIFQPINFQEHSAHFLRLLTKVYQYEQNSLCEQSSSIGKCHHILFAQYFQLLTDLFTPVLNFLIELSMI